MIPSRAPTWEARSAREQPHTPAFDARALKRFSLSAGVREEVYGHRQSQISPTVSGGYWMSTRLKFRASASRAFRLPSYTDLYYHDPANIGSPNLRPERAWSYEGGADIYIRRDVRAVRHRLPAPRARWYRLRTQLAERYLACHEFSAL